METSADRDEAIRRGCTLFQGHYFCRPEILSRRDVRRDKFHVLRFLAELQVPDPEMQRIEGLVRAQVALSGKLLRYLNSAAFGWKHRVASIEHALRVLGLVQLRKWAALMAVMTLADDRPAELVRTALVRAQCAERVCALYGPEGSCTQAFLTGLLSLLDAMVGRPMGELLGELAVTPAVFSGLLEGAAPLGSILRLVVARERAAWAEVEDGARELGLGEGDLARAYAESLQWADTVLAAGG